MEGGSPGVDVLSQLKSLPQPATTGHYNRSTTVHRAVHTRSWLSFSSARICSISRARARQARCRELSSRFLHVVRLTHIDQCAHLNVNIVNKSLCFRQIMRDMPFDNNELKQFTYSSLIQNHSPLDLPLSTEKPRPTLFATPLILWKLPEEAHEVLPRAEFLMLISNKTTTHVTCIRYRSFPPRFL